MAIPTKKTRYAQFAKNFKFHLEKWKSADGKRVRSNEDFIAALDAVLNRENCITATSISYWANSRQYPRPDIMPAVCEVLGVTEEELNTAELQTVITQEKYKYCGAADFIDIREKYGIDEDFMKYFLNIAGYQYQPTGIIQLNSDGSGYVRSVPDLPVNDTDDLLSDINLSMIRLLTAEDFKALKDIQDHTAEYMDLLITKHNAVLADQISAVNRKYTHKGKPLSKAEELALAPNNEQQTREYKEKEKELRGKYGKREKIKWRTCE